MLRVVIKNPGYEPFEAMIPGALEPLQAIVNGNIEPIVVDDGLTVICNEEGIINAMPINTNVYVYGEQMMVFGPIIFCYTDEQGEKFMSLDDEGVIAAIRMCEEAA